MGWSKLPRKVLSTEECGQKTRFLLRHGCLDKDSGTEVHQRVFQATTILYINTEYTRLDCSWELRAMSVGLVVKQIKHSFFGILQHFVPNWLQMALFPNLSLPLISTSTDFSVYKSIRMAFKLAHLNVYEKINGKLHIKNVDIRLSITISGRQVQVIKYKQSHQLGA